MIKAMRLVRFKGFEDSGWIHLRKITLLFGLNSSGKTSILNALLMLKQSLENPAMEVPFTFHAEKGIDIGTYEEVVHKHVIDKDHPVELWFKMDLGDTFLPEELQSDLTFIIRIGYNKKRETVGVHSISILDRTEQAIFNIERDIERSTYTIISKALSKVSDVEVRKWYNFFPSLAIKDRNNLSFPTIFMEDMSKPLRDFLNMTTHIGPLRTEVSRAYHFTGESPNEVGRRGEDALKLLYLDRLTDTQELTQRVNKWLTKYNYQFAWKSFGGGFSQLILRDTRSNVEVNVKDVGFGISQILPVIIQGYLPNKDQTVLVEQPEIHLHAGAQAELGDLFIDMANQTGKRFLTETHSEHLLLRLRRRIAQTTLSVESGDEAPFPLRPEDVAIHFVESTQNGSIVHLLGVEDTGQLTDIPDAFRSFFADDFEETMKITETIAKLKQARQNTKE